MLNLIPIQYRIAIIAISLVAAAGFGLVKGMAIQGERDQVTILTNQHAYDDRIAAADVAKDAANAKAATLSGNARTDVDDANAKYRRDHDAQDKAMRERIAALTSGRERMRVDAVCKPANAAGSGQLPGPATAAGGSDASASGAELSAAAAGRLAAVAAHADEVTRQLVLAQDTIRAYLKACGPQPAAAPAPAAAYQSPDEIAKRRSIIGPFLPNPHDK